MIYRRTTAFGTIAYSSLCHKRQSCRGFSPRKPTSRRKLSHGVYPTGICPSLPGRPYSLAAPKRKKVECAKSQRLLSFLASTSREKIEYYRVTETQIDGM